MPHPVALLPEQRQAVVALGQEVLQALQTGSVSLQANLHSAIQWGGTLATQQQTGAKRSSQPRSSSWNRRRPCSSIRIRHVRATACTSYHPRDRSPCRKTTASLALPYFLTGKTLTSALDSFLKVVWRATYTLRYHEKPWQSTAAHKARTEPSFYSCDKTSTTLCNC